jgi:hypothetical protein
VILGAARRTASRARFIAFWAPRLGDEGAALRWAWANTQNLAYVLNFVSLPCIFAGAWAHIPALVVVGILIYAVQGGLIVLMFRRLRAMHQAVSAAVGLQIGVRGTPGPPRPAAAYERWCKKYGVVPYTANRKTPTPE